MNPRTTALLALVALVLGAFVYFYEIEGQRSRDEAAEAGKRVFADLDASDIDVLELATTDGIDARFERQEGSWRVTKPVEGRGDTAALDAIAGALAQLPRAGQVPSEGGDLGQFGLGDAAKTIRFEVGGKSHGLRIGRATPVGGHVYVAREGDSEVAYVESYRLNATHRDLTALRDRRLAPLEPALVRRLELRWPDGGRDLSLVLERAADGDWRITSPIRARADQETVRELLSDLEFLEATGFVDAPAPELEKPLAETALVVHWGGSASAAGDASGAGSDAPSAPDAERVEQGSLRFAGVEGEYRLVENAAKQRFRIPAERLDDLPRELARYRDRQLVDFPPESIERIELELAAASASADEDGSAAALQSVATEKIGLVRDRSGWRADGRALAQDAINGLVDVLASLRAEAIVADEMGENELAGLRLAPPRARIRVEAKATDAAADGNGDEVSDGDRAGGSVEIELGRLDDERGLFARRRGEPAVYVLAADLGRTLPLDRPGFDERYLEPPAPEQGDAEDAGGETGAAAGAGGDPEAEAVGAATESSAADDAGRGDLLE